MKKKSFLENINSYKKMLSLDRKRKEAIRAFITRFIDEEAVSSVMLARPTHQSPNFLFTRLIKPMHIVLGMLIVSLVGGGVSFAAEGALPGELLYKMKTGVNEEVFSLLSISNEAKAEWETRRAERRLEEAEELANSGSVDVSLGTELEKRFQAHAEQASIHVKAVAEEGNISAAASIASEFEAKLKAHEAVVESVKMKDAEVAPLGQSVRSVLKNVVAVRSDFESKIETKEEAKATIQTDAEGKLASATAAIEVLAAELELNSKKLDEKTRIEIDGRLAASEKVLAEAKLKFSKGLFTEAFKLANQAIRVSHDAQLRLKARTSLNINVGGEFDDGEFDATTSPEVKGTSTPLRGEVEDKEKNNLKIEFDL